MIVDQLHAETVARLRKLKPTQAAVLIVIARYTDRKGETFVSVGRVAREIEKSHRHTQRTIAELEAMGIIHREARFDPRKRPGQTQTSNLYRIPAVEERRRSRKARTYVRRKLRAREIVLIDDEKKSCHPYGRTPAPSELPPSVNSGVKLLVAKGFPEIPRELKFSGGSADREIFSIEETAQGQIGSQPEIEESEMRELDGIEIPETEDDFKKFAYEDIREVCPGKGQMRVGALAVTRLGKLLASWEEVYFAVAMSMTKEDPATYLMAVVNRKVEEFALRDHRSAIIRREADDLPKDELIPAFRGLLRQEPYRTDGPARKIVLDYADSLGLKL